MEDRLQKFARLTEIGSFTKAAKALHISQPALSIAIDKLEQELGIELLLRGNRKLELTEAGKAAYKTALEHQASTEQLESTITAIARRKPTIIIGMTDSVAAVLCATEPFDSLEQSARVTVVVNNSRYLRAAVEQRQIDIAYIIDDGLDRPNLHTTHIGSEQLVLVCRPDIATTVAQDVQQGKLRNFICYDKASTTYRHIQDELQRRGIKPLVSLYSTSPEVTLGVVLRGKGIGVLPKLLVTEYLQQGRLSNPCEPLYISRPISAVTLTGKHQPEALRSFIDATGQAALF